MLTCLCKLSQSSEIPPHLGKHGQAVVADRVIFGCGTLLERSLDGSHPTQLLLQKRFGMPIGFIKRLDGIFEIVKVAELMRDVWENKGHRTLNRLFAIRDNAFDRHLQWLQELLNFL